jgi:hypothetical protein
MGRESSLDGVYRGKLGVGMRERGICREGRRRGVYRDYKNIRYYIFAPVYTFLKRNSLILL